MNNKDILGEEITFRPVTGDLVERPRLMLIRCDRHTISISKAAWRHLGEPEYVSFAISDDDRYLSIFPGREGAEGSFPVTQVEGTSPRVYGAPGIVKDWVTENQQTSVRARRAMEGAIIFER